MREKEARKKGKAIYEMNDPLITCTLKSNTTRCMNYFPMYLSSVLGCSVQVDTLRRADSPYLKPTAFCSESNLEVAPLKESCAGTCSPLMARRRLQKTH